MGRVLDTLHKKLYMIQDDPELILDPLFMNDIFKSYRDELPPFQEYWNLMFKTKQMKVIARKDGTRVVHYGRLRKYLFGPTRATDKETTEQVVELASVAVKAVISELENEKKATYKYLDISGSDYCYANSSDERKRGFVGSDCYQRRGRECSRQCDW